MPGGGEEEIEEMSKSSGLVVFIHVQQLENGIVVRTPDVASIAQRTIGVAYEHFTNSLDDTSITPKRSQGGGNQAALPHTSMFSGV